MQKTAFPNSPSFFGLLFLLLFHDVSGSGGSGSHGGGGGGDSGCRGDGGDGSDDDGSGGGAVVLVMIGGDTDAGAGVILTDPV